MAFGWAVALRSAKGSRFNSDLGPGDHWWANFQESHPEITLKNVHKLDRS